jgi:phage/plasmid-associated DNA primase
MDKKESKQIVRYFDVTINTQENNVYKILQKELIEVSENYKREKNTGNVYKKVKPYAYVFYKSPMDYLNEVFYGDEDFKSNVNNMDNMIKYMKQYDDPKFNFMNYNEDYIGFRNGIFNILTTEFTETNDINDETIVVKKYFDYDFSYSKETPILDSVLNYQFSEDVRDFLYACMGRMFKIRDDYQFMLYLLGEPGTGKSLLLEILSACFDKIGVIGESYEQKYGLGYLYNKDIIICDDLPKDISKIFPQQVYQTVVSCGTVDTAVKNGEALSIKWKVPMIWAGNWYPSYVDKGQISRRLLVANYERNVYNPDPTLKTKIINEELPAFIYKCLSLYHKILEEDGKKDIWHICPDYFLEQQEEVKVERNPLYKYLLEHTRYKKDNIVPLEEIRKNFNQWIGKNVKGLDNGTFGQVNENYIISSVKTCKHCTKEHKKGCCEDYNRSERSSKKIVRNIELLEEK